LEEIFTKNTLYLSIKDGNHAAFGSYGHQKGEILLLSDERSNKNKLSLNSFLLG